MKRSYAWAATCFVQLGLTATTVSAQESANPWVPVGAAWKKGEVLRTSANVEHIRFTPDGRLAVLASQRGVSVWDWKKEREISAFSFPKGTRLAALALSGDGKHLASSHVDSTRVLLWDLEKGLLVRQLNHEAPVHALAFAADGRFLAAGGGHLPEEKVERDCYIQLWRVADGKSHRRYAGPERPIRTIALAADSLVAEDQRGAVFVWNRVTDKLSGSFVTHALVTPLAMISEGRVLIGYEVGAGRFLSRWDSALGMKEQLIDMSPTNQGGRPGFWCSPDGNLAAMAHPGEILIWDLKAKVRLCTLAVPREHEALALAFAKDTSEVVVALGNETVARIAVAENK